MFGSEMDSTSEVEVRVLCEVIEAVDGWLREYERAGRPVIAPRAQVYASVIHAVLASARAGGYYGPGSLASAPLLDAILAGPEINSWDDAVLAVLMPSVESREVVEGTL
ncbi:MAG: hypothetical protein JWN03_4261 [Nocardia sp.]|uniref:hypothetical protein n=1 Tax=Nocardia sp. TaxID=1821 RepID=UPI0026369E23|nr:hypothetical protein [Nocardia sp.]MCU1643986.1 hypothetical protein [Nocardia sp.]